MAFVDPVTVQDPAVNVVASHTWGDAVNAAFNWLHAAKAGCLLTTAVSTAVTTDTAIPWATETYDVNGCHDTGSNTSRITVPTNWAGLWFVFADIFTTTGESTAWVRVNGTTKIVGQSNNYSGAANSGSELATIYDMAVGDYFEIVVTGGSNIDGTGGTGTNRFGAYWMAG